MLQNQAYNIDWQLFDRGYIPLRRCSLCVHQEKFEPMTDQNYYCGRLGQWTAAMFECPFWEARQEWKTWYAQCT
ncbi:MAG TPA: hypothetical protein VEB88_01100, partial [Candidatus Acidoferrales bacterium]|nr:hypothetical protein [Candidatus Acidoferrales bacterium]